MATTKEKTTALKRVICDIEELFTGMDNCSAFKESVFYLDSMRDIEILNEMIEELKENNICV